MASVSTSSEPVLRTLSPALKRLEKSVRDWLAAPHRHATSTVTVARLEGLANDLGRQGNALDLERPQLVLLLMGGTGVGKSTLLNALAGGDIADASFARPTTRDPVVYYHESMKPDRLDPALQRCRLAVHQRPELEQKILVDTPDLDSNDLSNREKLAALLPIADIVLYVGSQEKYHDKLGWDLFNEQRRRHAFAFVLNKWDRCQQLGSTGVRPDVDLLRDLKAQGFTDPLLFRTCAQRWIDHRGEQAPANLPDGEQFQELSAWINKGLNRLEIEAIKARGVSQLLADLLQALEKARPPDLTEVAQRTKAAWEPVLKEEVDAINEVLLNTLEPYQREIEHHFTIESQKRFRGLMAMYLGLVTRVKGVGISLRDYIPMLPRPAQVLNPSTTWDLTAFTRACSGVAGERHLDARGKALSNRLLLEADQQGFPMQLLTPSTEAAAGVNWRQRYAQMLSEVLKQVEQQWSKPTGVRLIVQNSIVFLADWLPSLAGLGVALYLIWQITVGRERGFGWTDLFLPPAVMFVVLVLLHISIAVVMPMRWPFMRNEFQKQLKKRLERELESTYSAIPVQIADMIQAERRDVEAILAQTSEVQNWLGSHEQAANIGGLYGK